MLERFYQTSLTHSLRNSHRYDNNVLLSNKKMLTYIRHNYKFLQQLSSCSSRNLIKPRAW